MDAGRIIHRIIFVGLLAAAPSVPARSAAAQTPTPATLVGREQREAIQRSLTGAWAATIGQVRVTLEMRADGGFQIGGEQGSYRLEGNMLVLRSDRNEVAYGFTLEAGKLTLSGGDLARPVEFVRVRGFGGRGGWLSSWSLPGAWGKLGRILVIVLTVVVARTVLWGSRAFVHFLVYSEWGPLKLIYRFHKKRTITIYSLVLNVTKYAIYLLALGLILTELGIDYTVYFASLSVIGLAIGFGSQGLVQDMVTGFFIVFEEQFNVGDMVEIPPQTGLVEDLGLRMTRLRNYMGQRVVIPNRNIAAVGNYLRGAQQVYVDVAVAAGTDAEAAGTALRQVAQETARQFHDVILSPPEDQGEIQLSTGERFVRLHVAIWPGQPWIVEQELLARIRKMMAAKGLEIPNDRISVFYHPREPQPLRPGPRRRNKVKRTL
jgi:small-conductance mechanosensitive channel